MNPPRRRSNVNLEESSTQRTRKQPLASFNNTATVFVTPTRRVEEERSPLELSGSPLVAQNATRKVRISQFSQSLRKSYSNLTSPR